MNSATKPVEQKARELVDRLIATAWTWGHGCSTDDISNRETVGDSYNEGGREETNKAGNEIAEMLVSLADRLDAMTESRNRTRTALENMRAERDDALNTDGERIRGLEEALGKAGDKFDLYAQLHRLKCTAEGDEKADRNQEMADYCRSLSTPSKGVG